MVAGHRETLHRTLELGASATHALSGSVRLRATLGAQHLRSELKDVWPAPCSTCASATQWERQQSLGYYFQGNIGLRERVFVTAAVRHDHFDAANAGTTYPSVGVSWLVRAVDSASFSLLRLRAAYGSAGLEPSGVQQVALVREGRWQDAERALDRIERRFGPGAAMPATLLTPPGRPGPPAGHPRR